MLFLGTQHLGDFGMLGNHVGQFIGIIFEIVKDITVAIANELVLLVLNHVYSVLLGMGKHSVKGIASQQWHQVKAVRAGNVLLVATIELDEGLGDVQQLYWACDDFSLAEMGMRDDGW